MLHTVSKAGKVLNLFSMKLPEWGVNEVAKELGIPKSTVSELMASLAGQGLLERTNGGRYRLGWKLFELSRTLVETTDFYGEARHVMQELVERWGETVHLGVLHGSQLVCIEKQQARSTVEALLSGIDSALPLYGSSGGKVLLAYHPWPEALGLLEEQALVALTPKTITTWTELTRELEQVRRQGFACDLEEVIVGLCSISAPIYNGEGRVIAAIGLLVPAYRFYPQQTSYAAIILDAAHRISQSLGYRAERAALALQSRRRSEALPVSREHVLQH